MLRSWDTVISVPRAAKASELNPCHRAVPYFIASESAQVRGTGTVLLRDGTLVLHRGQRLSMR